MMIIEDLKQYVEVNENKLRLCLSNENKLGKLSFLQEDVSDWIACLSYQKNRDELANFLMYRCAGAWNLHGKVDDADVCPCAMEYLKEKLFTIPEVTKVEIGREIAPNAKLRTLRVTLMDGSVIYLESDTGNSLMRDVGLFYRLVLTKRFGYKWPEETYIKEFDLAGDGSANYYRPFKLYYFYTLLERFPQEQMLDAEEKECLQILQQRASLTHTLQNMIVVPYGYNQVRGRCNVGTHISKQKIQDDLDLSILDMEEMLSDRQFQDTHLQARLHNTYVSMRSIRFILDHKETLFPKIPSLEGRCREESLWGIIERSKRIIETLQ